MQEHRQIPAINRDAPLVTRLLPIVMVGVDGILDKKSQLYFRLLARLIDKSFDEYSIAKECIDKEIETENKLAYRFDIINHLENCISAIHRAIKILRISENEKCNLLEFISKDTLERIKKYNVSHIRNRIEHIDEDIQEDKFQGKLFLDVDENYEKMCINEKYLPLNDLALIIEDYHKAVLEICNNLPNRIENGKYYWDKSKPQQPI